MRRFLAGMCDQRSSDRVGPAGVGGCGLGARTRPETERRSRPGTERRPRPGTGSRGLGLFEGLLALGLLGLLVLGAT